MTWLSNQSNLLKFGWYQVNENEKHIIDNNELAEKKIEKYQAEEAKRREALEKGEPVPAFGGFEEGLGFEQINAYDDSQNIIGNTNFGDSGGLDDFQEGFGEGFSPEQSGYDMDYDNSMDTYGEGMDDGFNEGIPADNPEYSAEGFDNAEAQMSEDDMNPGMEMEQEAPQEPEAEPAPQINLEEIQAQIDEQIRMAEEEAKQIVEDANSQAEQIKNQAKEEGRNDGYNEGLAQAAEEIEKMKAEAEAEIAAEKEKQQADFQQLLASIEPDMVDTLTQIYEHVFNIEFREKKEIILHLIRTTLGKIDSGKDIILHISADDYDLVTDEKQSLEEAMASPNSTLEIIEDPTLRENECIIESEGGLFDCSLGIELEELTRTLKLLSFDRNKR